MAREFICLCYPLIAFLSEMPEKRVSEESPSGDGKKQKIDLEKEMKELIDYERSAQVSLALELRSATTDLRKLEIELQITRTDIKLANYSLRKLDIRLDQDRLSQETHTSATVAANDKLQRFQEQEQQYQERIAEIRARELALVPKIAWGKIMAKPTTIASEGLCFVNRTDAIENLVRIHSRIHALQQNDFAGRSPTIALIDNLFGMGKTTLARNYISMAPQAFSSRHSDTFKASLSAARTVVVTLAPSCLVGPAKTRNLDALQDAVRKQFVMELQTMISDNYFCEGSSVGFLEDKNSERSFTGAVRRFIDETGSPLFLVLDEIGDAFAEENVSVIKQREYFLYFCRTIISGCLRINGLFLLLIGKADFLDLVANRTPCSPKLNGSSIIIERIGLKMIRQEHIGTILDRTYRDDQPLSQLYGANEKNSHQRDEAINAILAATNGHPRSVCDMLSVCTTLAALKAYEPPACMDYNAERWILALMDYSEGIQILMDKVDDNGPIDLTKKAFPDIRQSKTLAQLADSARIRYEGTLQDARVFASLDVKRHLAPLFFPLRAFLMELSLNSLPRYNHEGNLELCCLRRFQEMFRGEAVLGNPESRFPQWFAGTTFGELEGFRLNRTLTKIPKITSAGSTSMVSLEQSTAVPELWPNILELMRKLEAPRSFIPADMSASTDVLMVTSAILKGENRTVTIGLAVKCTQSPLAAEGPRNSVNREKEIFNRMFLGSTSYVRDADDVPSIYSGDITAAAEPILVDEEDRCSSPKILAHSNEKTKLGQDLNILIVCSTGGFSGVRFPAGRNYASSLEVGKYDKIHETIYLDLSNTHKRASFFGVADDEHLAEKIEWMVGKKDNKTRTQ